MDRLGFRQVQEDSGEQRKMEETSCEIICGAQTTLAVKGLMMMMMTCPFSCVSILEATISVEWCQLLCQTLPSNKVLCFGFSRNNYSLLNRFNCDVG